MMTVVIYNQELFSLKALSFTPYGKAAAHALKGCECFFDGFHRNVQRQRDADRCQRVQNVVNTGKVHRDLFRSSTVAHQRKVHLRSVRADVFCTDLSIFSEAISQNRFSDLRQDGANVFAFDAHDSAPVEGQSLNEVCEGLSQISEIVPIRVHVVFIDVGNHRNHRRQV